MRRFLLLCSVTLTFAAFQLHAEEAPVADPAPPADDGAPAEDTKISVDLEAPLAKSVADLMAAVSDYDGGTNQGYTGYGMQIECANKDGETTDGKDMKCFIRSNAGFSRTHDPVRVISSVKLTEDLVKVLNDHDGFSYLIDNGFNVVGGIITCAVDTGANTPPDAPTCTLTPAN